jgi:hypothetical protein
MLRCWLYIHEKEKETDRSIENDTACWEAAGGSGLIVYGGQKLRMITAGQAGAGHMTVNDEYIATVLYLECDRRRCLLNKMGGSKAFIDEVWASKLWLSPECNKHGS